MRGIPCQSSCAQLLVLGSEHIFDAGADTQAAKFFINCLAEEPTTVAQYLVPRIRQAPTASKGLGGGGKALDIRFLTKPKAYAQILLRLVAQQRKNRWVQE